MNKESLVRMAQTLSLSSIACFSMSACMNSEEGMLSDDDKIKRAQSGRESYSQGMRDGGGKPANTAPPSGN